MFGPTSSRLASSGKCPSFALTLGSQCVYVFARVSVTLLASKHTKNV